MKDTDDIRGLAEVSEAYARARFDELPPEEVDRAIRAAAARATRHHLLAARAPTWALPFAIAATLVIGVAALLRINDVATVTNETAQTSHGDQSSPAANESPSGGATIQPAPGSVGTRSTKFVLPEPELPAEGCDETAAADRDVWLECILALRQQGSLEQAAREIEKFRARFRGTDLPPELEETPSR
jgi:hypothetical protein